MMKPPTPTAFLLLLALVFSSFHGKVAAFDEDSNLNKTQQMLNAIATTSSSCQGAVNQCILSVKKYVDLQDQERFCDIMELQAKDPVVTQCVAIKDIGCSALELAKLGEIACDRENDDFRNAVLQTSSTCQGTVETCILISERGKVYVSTAKYCDLVNVEENGVTAEQCLTAASGCTSSEYSDIHDAACGACGFTATVMLVMLSLIFVVILIP